MRAALLAIVLAAPPALALEAPQWPPPAGMLERMRELQQRMSAPEATAAQREAAREELSGLLKSPAGQARGRTPDERPARAPRAAIEPYPAIVRPTEITTVKPPPAEGVARLEVVDPPRPVVDPRTGAVMAPLPGFTVDPRTGGVLHAIPGGFVDPRTGQVVPR